MPSQTARGTAANHIRVRTQRFQQLICNWEGIADEVPGSVSALAIDAIANVGLGLFSETFECGDPAFLACLFELLNGLDPQFFMDHFYFFRAEPRDFEHSHQPGRCGGPE